MKNNSTYNLSILPQRTLDILSGRRGKYRHRYTFMKYGWTAIPCVKTFEHIVGEYDERWSSIGLKIRHKGKIRATMTSNKSNKYMEYQIKRLEKLKSSDPQKYFQISLKLMRKSVVFRMSAFRRIEKNWSWKLSVSQIKFINNKVNNIFEKMRVDLTHYRVYIPKGDTFRPLGVPTLPWRIALHMFNNFLFQFVKPHFCLRSMVW